MKKTILSFILIMISVASWGAAKNDYAALWQQVDEKISKDLPRDAVAILKKISSKAEKEGQYGQLLAAELKQAQQMGAISPDSLEPAINRIKSKAATSKNVAVQSVYYAVLGGLDCGGISDADKKAYFDKALSHPEILKDIPASSYNPITMDEDKDEKALLESCSTLKASSYTLLDAISHEAKRYQWLSDYYAQNGNREKACLEMFYALRGQYYNMYVDYAETKACREKLLNGISIYGDLELSALLSLLYYNTIKEDDDFSNETKYEYLDSCANRWPNAEVTKSFRKSQQDLTIPKFNITTHDKDCVLPNKETRLYLTGIRNTPKIDIAVTPLKADGTLDDNGLNDEKAIEKYKKLASGNPVFTTTLTYSNPSYDKHIDSLMLPKLPVGVYLVEASTPDASMHRANLLYISDIRVLNIRLSDTKLRIISVSATTGKPIPNVTIRLSKLGWKDGKHQILKTKDIITDTNGEATLTLPERIKKDGNKPSSSTSETSDVFAPNIVYAFTSTDKAFIEQNFQHSHFYSHTNHQEDNLIAIFTDRRIYRPGQKIQGTFVVYNNYDIYNIHSVAGQKLKFDLTDENWDRVYEDSVITDSMGHAPFSIDIPSGHTNGMWQIHVNGNNTSSGRSYIRVEEYKRPTFEIITPKLEKCYYLDTKNGETKTVNADFQVQTFSQAPVQNAKVTYSIRRSELWRCWWCPKGYDRTFADNVETTTDATGHVKIPVELSLPERSSGRYRFYVSIKVTNASGETHEGDINIPVCTSDLKSPEKKELKPEEREEFFDISSDVFPADGNVTLRMGSTLSNLRAYYTIISEKGVVENGSVDFSHEIISRSFIYKESYGEGLSIFYIWMKDGKAHKFSRTINKPQPDTHLKTRWITFRDHTQPGSKEKWTLRIENRKLKAQNCGTFSLYDKSLDQINKHSWVFNVLNGYIYKLSTGWNKTHQNDIVNSSYADIKHLSDGRLPAPSGLNHDYYPSQYLSMTTGSYDGSSRPHRMMASRVNNSGENEAKIAIRGLDVVGNEDASALDEAPVLDEVVTVVGYGGKLSKNAGGGSAASLKSVVRTNFNETAFFTPNLLADKDGNVSLEFTLPEAMTSWRLLGFVHDNKMRNCLLDSTCVAQKDIMVQPNMPRFIREGDNASISAAITNTTSKEIKAKAIMQLLTPGTETVVAEQSEDITLAAKGQASATFHIDASQFNDTLYTVRIAALSDNCQDGEQHNLAILPAREQITNTLPLTFFTPGTYTTNADSLWLAGATNKSLVVEYTDNPAWLMVESLPTLYNNDSRDAVSTMVAIYASSIANAIKQNVKDVNSNAVDSIKLAADTINSSQLIAHLKELQLADGSWPWWKGMDGSYYITTSIAQMIARQKVILGSIDGDLENMLAKAMAFMSKRADKEVQEMKRMEKKGYKIIHPSETTTDYLYIKALLKNITEDIDKFPNASLNYLIKMLEKIPAEYTILGKARAAVIFSAYNRTRKAKEYLESIRQYSVYTPLAGRYYDSPKAYYSWRNYRIPTEVAAIEALSTVAPEDTKTICEMQQWLLHEKRTTKWDTPLNTVDAVYAFMRPTTHYGAGTSKNSSDASINSADTKMAFLKTFSSAKHYRRDTLDANINHEVSITKSTSGTSWGAIYASQLAPLAAIDSASSGISVQREIIGDAHTIGSKVKVRITLKAERDYDFVTVTDNRPACLEPVETISTYHWGYYEEIKDQSTRYHINSLAKGKHVIETEYYIDRQGDYNSGTCTATCAFAPEFTGRAASVELKTEK